MRTKPPESKWSTTSGGCYCKRVSSMKNCPDHSRSWQKSRWDVEYERFFHPEVSPGSRKPHLCCKLAWTVWFDRKGLGYTKQATAERCFGETRPVEDACCRIGKEEQVAVRVKQIKAKAGQQLHRGSYSSWFYYKKSNPYISIKNIVSATDYDGSTLSIEQVKDLLHYKAQAGTLGGVTYRPEAGEPVYRCSKGLDQLMGDQEACHVRPDPTQCCCIEPSLLPAERCLPATGGATSIGPLEVKGSYAEHKAKWHKGKDRLEGNISWPETPEELDKDLADHLQSKDPEADDGLEYDWSRAAAQWQSSCKANQTVPWVREEREEYRSYTTHGLHRGYQTRERTKYYQEWKTECISKEFNRICPEGQGLYVKQFPLGTCANVPGPSNSDQLQLVGVAPLVFQCPDGYQSGAKGALKSSAHCRCDSC
eukprot:Skav217047  [mRNA]  locus=scaffold1849:7466:9570:+ [translate_table: standard]